MVERARAAAKKQGLKPPQVAFVGASLADDLPIVADSVDCVLSNCVINLLPKTGKEKIIGEIHRILKPGGRVVIDDVRGDLFLPSNNFFDRGGYRSLLNNPSLMMFVKICRFTSTVYLEQSS
jgi:arsenite methyltransferase